MHKNGTIDKLSELINNEPCGLLGVSVCTNSKSLDYYIVAPTDKPVLEDTHEYLIPSGTWAVFECVSPMPNALAIQELQKELLLSGYQVLGMCMLIYQILNFIPMAISMLLIILQKFGFQFRNQIKINK